MTKALFFIILLVAFTVTLQAQNVGIGTTNPLMRLHVSKGDSAVALLENTQALGPGVSNALYFKTGSNAFPYTGAIKTIGDGPSLARMGFFTYASASPNGLRESMSIADGGFVGIGTTSPGYRLDVNGRMLLRYNGASAGMWLNKADNSNEAVFVGNFNDTTYGIYTNTGSGWKFFFNHQNGNMGIGNSNPRVDLSFPASLGKKISLYPGGTGDAGMGVYGNELRLHSDHSNADITFGYDNFTNGFTERMRVKGDGRVCIGTSSPAAGYLLSVNGKVIAEEVRVQLKGSWPDYVFNENYKLPSLSSVKDFIETNKHLPNIPAAAEIEKNGVDVGDMQKKMMEKVEQLTLYVIDLQQQITDLKSCHNEKK